MQAVNCEGWWEQRGLGRQLMTDLRLRFVDGEIIGHGSDLVGEFVLNGTITGDRVSMFKQYNNKHQVGYPGTFDGEGTLQGLWNMDHVGGRWLIKIVGTPDADSGITTIEPNCSV